MRWENDLLIPIMDEWFKKYTIHKALYVEFIQMLKSQHEVLL